MTTTQSDSTTARASGYLDYELARLEQVPLSSEHYPDSNERRHVETAAAAVGQIVVRTPRGVQIDNQGQLRVPATRLRNAEFLGGLPLYQDIGWDLNPFFDEYIINSFATASVYKDRKHILTACHAIDVAAISAGLEANKQAYFLFGRDHRSSFATPSGSTLRIPPANYRRCVDIVSSQEGRPESGQDWIIIELDEEVPDVLPLMPMGNTVPTDLFMLHHPLGLPIKYGKATATKDSPNETASIFADVGAGSSGSPVLYMSEKEGPYLYGILGGGRVGFDRAHLRPTRSGTVIDPTISRERRPPQKHPITNIDTIEGRI